MDAMETLNARRAVCVAQLEWTTLLPGMRAFARVLTRNREHADRIVHDALTRLRRRERVFGLGSRLELEMLRTVHDRHCAMQWEPCGPKDEAGQAGFAPTFWDLPDRLREALFLHLVADLAVTDIAAICQCPESAVLARLAFAKAAMLRAVLTADGTAGAEPCWVLSGETQRCLSAR